MSPEERLEALRDDARWQPITLYPEHGRMPAPVRVGPWRSVVRAAVVLAVIALVFGGVVAYRGFAAGPRPASYAGAPTPSEMATPGPLIEPTLSADDLLAKAVLPPQAAAGRVDSVGTTLPNSGELCGMTTIGASFWSVSGMSVDEVVSWLDANRPKGMTAGTFLRDDQGAAMTQSGSVFDVASTSSRQGLLFSVMSPAGVGTMIRVDAVSLPQTAECVIEQLQVTTVPPSASAASQAELQAAAAAKAAQLAAEATAQEWADGAVLPPGATRSDTAPQGAPGSPGPQAGWCPALTGVVNYWTVPGMSAVSTRDWLTQHRSPGMTFSAFPSSSNSSALAAGASELVIEQPTATSDDGMLFDIAQVGSGSVVRLDSYVGTDASCQ